MDRRDLLRVTAAAGGSMALAGCAGLFETQQVGEPPVLEDRPDAVYRPTHTDGMQMVGMQTAGPYSYALMYSAPHRFWTINGQAATKVSIEESDSVHLMVVVFDTESGLHIPGSNPTITVEKDGALLTELTPWQMLSQPMGFHFGDNVSLSGDGSYTVVVESSPPAATLTGGLQDRLDVSGSVEFGLEFSQSTVEELSVSELEDAGSKGAVEPRSMKLSSSQLPLPADLPGTELFSATSGDALFEVRELADATRFGGDSDQSYLAVSPRTPYNRYMIPGMALDATVESTTQFDGSLSATLDSELRFHYGTLLDEPVASGDSVSIRVATPPQLSRHEGYETAFRAMSELSTTV